MTNRSSPHRLIGLAVASLCAAFGARAEEFSWQLSAVTSRAESGDFSRDSWAVDGTYYLNPLDDSTGPYALASFLNPTTRVTAAASKTEAELVSDPAAYTVGGAFVLPGEKWYVGADYSRSKVDDTPLATYSDPKGYGLRAGRYLGDNTTLAIGLGRSEQETSFACAPGGGPSCIGPPFVIETTSDSVDLEVFHVRRFRALTYSLQASVSERDVDFEILSPMTALTPPPPDGDAQRVYSVAAELFPTNRLGVRLGYSRPDSDFDVDAYDVATTWFFTPRVAVQFSLSRAHIGDAPPSVDDPENAAVRFIGRL